MVLSWLMLAESELCNFTTTFSGRLGCACVLRGGGVENNHLLKPNISSKHVSEVVLWKTGESCSTYSQTMSFGVSYGAAASIPWWTLTNCQINPLRPLATLGGPSEVLNTALSPSKISWLLRGPSRPASTKASPSCSTEDFGMGHGGEAGQWGRRQESCSSAP